MTKSRPVQTKKASLLEASFNIISGAAIAFSVTQLLGPLLDYHITPSNNFLLTIILTVVSVIRSYVWRRIFENYRPGRGRKYG